jgi:hypothetical protein
VRLSKEVESIIAYVASTGLPYRVTSTTGGKHAPSSRHFQDGTDGKGLAVDFAGPKPGDMAAMLKIYRALLERADQLRELIYSGPGADVLVRRRLRVVPMTYGREVLAAHRNHVHVSVDRGTFLQPMKEAMVADDTNKMQAPLLAFVPTPTGKGYWMVSVTGEVHSYGDAEFFGRSEAPRA